MIARDPTLRLTQGDRGWRVEGSAVEGLVNEYLGYLGDRNYSPMTVRAYGFDLLAFSRWLVQESLALDEVTTDVLLRFLAACRDAQLPGRPGPNVITMGGQTPGWLRGDHDQPAFGRDLGFVRVPGDAGSRPAQPGPERP